MTLERWKDVSRIYAAAVQQPARARARYVEEACGADAELKRDVESLLASDAGEQLVDRAAAAHASVLQVMGATVGSMIGEFRIDALLGVGGMGEVYRARDTKLNRDVAIKVLPAEFARDPERLARFKREAQVLAALNHPNVAAIYGLEGLEGRDGQEPAGLVVPCLVLELVDGPTVAELIDGDGRWATGGRPGSANRLPPTAHGRRALPIQDALNIARQIAEALEAAHEQGIIHRDLKPANIKVRDDGTVKVLDFGLAKALEPGGSGGAGAAGRAGVHTQSPTITTPAMTAAGMIIGTAAYMSPEQAKGKPADKRSDIWAFGCVLYEMLTGARPFPGEDVADTIATILKSEPDLSRLPDGTPPGVRELIARALRKDPRQRLRDIAVARFLLEERAVSTPAHALSQTSPRAAWRVAFLGLAAGAVVFALWTLRPATAPPAPTTRFTIPLNASMANTARTNIAIAPDGRRLAYILDERIFLRDLSEFQSRPIAGTNDLSVPYNAGSLASPLFTTDGRALVFYLSGAGVKSPLMRIDLNGGVPVPVCGRTPFGMTWAGRDLIVAAGQAGILRCAPDGAETQVVPGEIGIELYGPELLPDGDLIFTRANVRDGTSRWDTAEIVRFSPQTGERRTLVKGASDAHYTAGYLFYVRGGVVYAAAFDYRTNRLGTAAVVVEGVRRPFAANTGASQFAVSSTGVMAYIPGPGRTVGMRAIAIADRAGSVTQIGLPPGPFEQVRISPNGRYLAVVSSEGNDTTIGIVDMPAGTALRRLTLTGRRNQFPVWTPDSRRLAYQSDRDGDRAVFWQRADGGGTVERLTRPGDGEEHIPESFSPDGRTLSFSTHKGLVYALSTLNIGSRFASSLGVTSGEPPDSVFSPDGKWIAYGMNKDPLNAVTSAWGIFVQPFPPTGETFQALKSARDFHPQWSPDGKELLYVPSAVSARMAALSFTGALTPTFGAPMLFPAKVTGDRRSGEHRSFDVMPDGRFIGVMSLDAQGTAGVPPTEIRVTLNWFDELRAKVPPLDQR